MRPRSILWTLATALVLVAFGPSLARAADDPASPRAGTEQHETILVSRASGADGASVSGWFPSVSSDGRYVAFESEGANGTHQVFVRDQQTDETILVSRATGFDGEPGNGVSISPSISADGRFVAFRSNATNLHPDDTDAITDVYLRDLQTGGTVLVSRASGVDGVKGNDESHTPLVPTSRTVSAEGRYVAFLSAATNLHPDDPDDLIDIYVRDLQTHETILVSRATGADGVKGDAWSLDPSISGDGRYVAFDSQSTSLHPDDTDSINDLFVRDLQTHETALVSRASGADGVKGNGHSVVPAISVNGRYVTFYSIATNFHVDDDDGIRDVYVRDLETHETILVSKASGPAGAKGNDDSFNGSVSDDGLYVAFQSAASNLHPDDTDFGWDMFVRNLQTHETKLASRASGADGVKANGWSFNSSFSANGRHVAFASDATNLHPDDTDGLPGVFMRDLLGPFTVSPELLDFGEVLIGATGGPLSVTLTNVGTEDVEVSDVSNPEAPFAFAGGTCGVPPFTLLSEEGCTLEYIFSPTALGPAETVVTVTSDSVAGPQTVTLRGTGGSTLSIAPNPLDFGDVSVGETDGPRNVTLANTGTQDVTVSDISTPAAPFAAVGGTCDVPPFTLVPEATCTLGYTFSPTTGGSIETTVAVVSDATVGPQTLTLRGRGISALSITPNPLDFGDVTVGGFGGPLSVTLTNVGAGEVTVSDISDPDSPFFSGGDSCGPRPFTLAHDESCLLDYGFGPTTVGPAEAMVTVASDAPGSPDTFTLQGTGVGVVELRFDPATLDFDEVDVGSTSAPQTATLQNIGATEVTGLSFSTPGSGFEAVDACGDTLPAGESCPVSVIFAPTEPGPAAASLEVSSNEGASAPLGLTGTGVGTGGFAPVALEVDPDAFLSDGNGIFEPGELAYVAPTWRNDGLVAVSLTGTASGFNGSSGAVYFLALDDADYGNVGSTEIASCRDTGVCYFLGVNDPAVRPATHWMATFDETLSDDTTKTWSLHIGDSFVDVPRANPFYLAVETLLHHGVTGGCTATEYCPAGTNTRGQMAVFLLKAAEDSDYSPPACEAGQELFADVPFDSPLCPWIEELAARQVTSGCGGGNYCPGDSVTRAQMAVFLLKAFEGGSYTPPECTGELTDVPCPSTFADWVEELSSREITGGCSTDPPAYCPSAPVTRQQMAVFVTKTFGLTLYGP